MIANLKAIAAASRKRSSATAKPAFSRKKPRQVCGFFVPFSLLRIILVYILQNILKIGIVLNNPNTIMHSLLAHVSIAALLLGWALFTLTPI
ncbi:hypothetical protein [Ferribacterium limneticum]|uniref:hypothetical protein n=1 Tax=Ferribacterium limneticum TaxID=76259 RepID=UPI001CF9F48A|nr:hypothetical protein [Ferribacterium limneticum]UCV27323.1 hypothetical protein KI617_13690 [Ferribacterium limneticum]UCV31240.1 hypothetical protein KI608_13690 [Ferribacterium limneticum]